MGEMFEYSEHNVGEITPTNRGTVHRFVNNRFMTFANACNVQTDKVSVWHFPTHIQLTVFRMCARILTSSDCRWNTQLGIWLWWSVIALWACRRWFFNHDLILNNKANPTSINYIIDTQFKLYKLISVLWSIVGLLFAISMFVPSEHS